MQQLQQHCLYPIPPSVGEHSYTSNTCARRLMQYLFHYRQRPPDNNILFWKTFVSEFFAQRAKKKLCLSLNGSTLESPLGIFSQASMLDKWHCGICRSKSGRGFEVTADVLPRLCKIEFDSGVIDELLFVDMPFECRLPSGLIMLEYGRAVQESIYKQKLRVVRVGVLRIKFTPNLKIRSWEFCAERTEQLLPRTLMTTQVNQLEEAAQKCQSACTERVRRGDLEENRKRLATATRQLVETMDLQLVDELGLSKGYSRVLQIFEVVNSMKDLMDFGWEHNMRMGPIESLKNYARQAAAAAAAKLQIQKMQEMEQLLNIQGVSADQKTVNKMMAVIPNLSSQLHNCMGGGTMNTSVETAAELSKYQNLQRRDSINMSSIAVQTDASCSSNGPNPPQALLFQCPASLDLASLPNATVNGLSSAHNQQPHVLQQNQQQSSPANQHLLQCLIQLLQQDMGTNGGIQQPLTEKTPNGNTTEGVFGELNGTGSLPMRAAGAMVEFGNKISSSSVYAAGMTQCRANGFTTAAGNSVTADGNGFSITPAVSQNTHLGEEVQDIPPEFSEDWSFDSELSDMVHGWEL
ncbi:hypothetical protein AAC387_Pa01g3332 [Persea americana]